MYVSRILTRTQCQLTPWQTNSFRTCFISKSNRESLNSMKAISFFLSYDLTQELGLWMFMVTQNVHWISDLWALISRIWEIYELWIVNFGRICVTHERKEEGWALVSRNRSPEPRYQGSATPLPFNINNTNWDEAYGGFHSSWPTRKNVSRQQSF